MNYMLLKLTAGFLSKVLALLALYYFLKGHNNPGGGFIGGLMLANALLLVLLANGIQKMQDALPLKPERILVLGVLLSLFSGLLPVIIGKAFFTGLWLPSFSLPLLGELHIGTPLLFDLGVFMTVLGFSLSIIVNLEKAE